MSTDLFHSCLLVVFCGQHTLCGLFNVNEDGALKHILPDLNLYQGTPKVWHQYTKAFLQKCLDKSSFAHLRTMLQKMLNWAILYSRYSQKLVRKPVEPNYSENITRASGTFVQQGVGTGVKNFRKLPVYGQYVTFVWILQLFRELRMTFYFDTIYFALSPVECLKGNLTIFQYFSNSSYFYCGQQSSFYLNPQRNKFCIRILVMNKIPYRVNTSFLVMDKNLIETVQDFHFTQMPNSSILIRKRDIVLSYIIQVKKVNKILLQFAHLLFGKYVVYDSPKFSSILLESTDKTFTSSTFQCLVQFVTERESLSGIFFTYSPQNLTFINISLTSNLSTIMNIPKYNCNKSLYAFSVAVPLYHHVNVTILNMSFEGQNTMTCAHGGLALLEKFEPSYSEVITFCDSHNGAVSQSRSIFSETSTFFFVLYWYSYSSIRCTIGLSSTRCEPIQIDICKFNTLCYSYKNTTECVKYLTNVFQMSKTDFRYHSLNRLLYFHVWQDQCAVLQLIQKLQFNTLDAYYVNYKYLSYCKFGMKMSAPTELGYVVHHEFKASSKLDRSDNEWHVSFRGESDKFCSKFGMNGTTSCLYSTCNLGCLGHAFFIDSFYQLSDEMNATDFSVTAETPTPLLDTSFHFDLLLGRWTQSWMYVVVWMSQVAGGESLQYPGQNVPTKKQKHRITKLGSDVGYQVLFQLSVQENSGIEFITTHPEMKLQLDPRPWFEYKVLEFRWTTAFNLSKSKSLQRVSLPGSIQRFEVDVSRVQNAAPNDILQFLWIHDNYKRYSDFTPECDEYDCVHVPTGIKGLVCKNYSFYTQAGYIKNKTYIYFEAHHKIKTRKIWRTIVRRTMTPLLWSWGEASQLCSDVSGYLPLFVSRTELNELLSFTKFSPHILPMDAIFIGMTSGKAQKVFLVGRGRGGGGSSSEEFTCVCVCV